MAFSFFNLFRRKKSAQKNPVKTGIVFSGGGTRGFAYIGVIKAFLESGIDFDMVAGTSVGSIIGAFYAANVPLNIMEERAVKMKQTDIFSSKIKLIPSKTERLEEFVAEILDGKEFDDLVKPFCAVAVDIKTGTEVHISSGGKGDLVKAIAGSCAIPGVFNAVPFKDMNLLDGGLTNNIPADALREMGADIVISIDINPTRGYGTDSLKTVELLKAALRILMKSNAVNGYVHSDYIIKLDLSKFSQLKIENIDEMIQLGYELTMQQIPEIKRVLERTKADESIKRVSRKIRAIQKKSKQIEKLNQSLTDEEKEILKIYGK